MSDIRNLKHNTNRRSLIKWGLCIAATGVVAPSLLTPAEAARFQNGRLQGGSRKISFRNTHTGESFSGVYRVGNKYLPDAFARINHVLRDHRTDEVFPLDPRLIDIVYNVHSQTGSREAFEIISGYRSPKTNANLRKVSSGVAKKSLHMSGQAIDLRLPGISTTHVRDIARSLEAGGVGYYSRSDFVHLDTGTVRAW